MENIDAPRKRLRVASLVPADYNPRTITERALGGLTASLGRYGLVQALVWNERSGRLVGGHQRLKVLLEQGVEYTTVAVVDLDDTAEKALNLAMNNPGAQGQYTDDLQTLLDEIKEDDLEAMLDLNLGDLEVDVREWEDLELRDADLVEPELADKYAWVQLAVMDFSGGRDSSAALLWAKHNLPDARIVALFVDQGAEYPGYELHVRQVADVIGVELVVLRTPVTLFDGLLSKGWPGWVGPWCQATMHRTLADWLAQHGNKETTLRLTGSRRKQRKATSKRGKEDPLSSTPQYRALAPIYDWTNAATAKILATAGVPLWEGYSRGLNRTCCWMCPGQRMAGYAILRRDYPCLYRAFLELEQRIGPMRSWGGGRSLAEAADRGSEMLAAKGVAEEDEGQIECEEELSG